MRGGLGDGAATDGRPRVCINCVLVNDPTGGRRTLRLVGNLLVVLLMVAAR